MREKQGIVGVGLSCTAELKLLLTAALLLTSLITLLQFLPSRFSPSDLRRRLSNPTAAAGTATTTTVNSTTTTSIANSTATTAAPPLQDGVVRRDFTPYGAAAYNFILMSAYRGGLNTFAITGLSSKPLHVFGRPTYLCEWVPRDTTQKPISAASKKILPDWGYGRVYTVVVVNCTFSVAVGGGGKLLLHATTNGGGDRGFNSTDPILALSETPQDFNKFSQKLNSRPKFDFIYCGSSLYGNLSPQRFREWLAYHVKLFGENSHFVFHDAGGVHGGVMEVLRPWMEKGYVTLEDIREQERFDGYYHNQFLVVNDCLHRYRFDAKWMFFFDVDEFIFVPGNNTIKSVVNSLKKFTQFTIEQITMSSKLCLVDDSGKTFRKWGFEKLVFKDIKRGIRRDRKYAVQPRYVYATGVHMSQNVEGKTTHNLNGRIRYFHYHGTIAQRREPCRQMVYGNEITMDGTPYVMDTTMRDIAGSVKRFELKTIGSTLNQTQR